MQTHEHTQHAKHPAFGLPSNGHDGKARALQPSSSSKCLDACVARLVSSLMTMHVPPCACRICMSARRLSCCLAHGLSAVQQAAGVKAAGPGLGIRHKVWHIQRRGRDSASRAQAALDAP